MYFKKPVAVFLSVLCLPALAADVWAATGNVPASDAHVAASSAPAESPEKVEEQQAFCSANALLKSDFIRASVWPGIGPFDVVTPKDSGSNSDNKSVKLTDPAGNQVTYTFEGNEIKTCELELHNCVGDSQGLLNLQMSSNFLLEGLGVKPWQIHVVNTELSKKSKLLIGNNYNPVSATIAPLTVSFQNLGTKEGTGAPLFRVAVVNQGKSNEKTGAAETTTSKAETDNSKTAEVDIANLSETPANPESASTTKDTSSQTEPGQDNNKAQSENSATATSPATESGAPPSKPSPAKPLSKEESLKKQFLDLITNWQRIKKTAVHDHKTDQLSQALSGKALAKQSDGIKWLASNHKYYEMISQSAVIEHFDPLLPGKKYAVFAEVKEKSKFMDESNKQQLKETDDTYKVNYTIEKIGAHWFITDSALIKQGNKKTDKSGAKSTH